MGIPMGIGALGFQNVVFKRKFRYTLSFEDVCIGGGARGSIPPDYVKIASRPNVDIDDVEIHYLNGVDWIPGKGRLQTMNVTYHDVATDRIAPLYNWLATVWGFNNADMLYQGSQRRDYAGRGILTLYDGCGQPLERWVLDNMWPKTIDWGELDYSNSDISEIQITFRYSKVSYFPLCPAFSINPCCTPCG